MINHRDAIVILLELSSTNNYDLRRPKLNMQTSITIPNSHVVTLLRTRMRAWWVRVRLQGTHINSLFQLKVKLKKPLLLPSIIDRLQCPSASTIFLLH
jgi:hypothetical protein